MQMRDISLFVSPEFPRRKIGFREETFHVTLIRMHKELWNFPTNLYKKL